MPDTMIRPNRQQKQGSHGGGAALVLIGGGGLIVLGLYELTKPKQCPAGQVLVNGQCVTPTVFPTPTPGPTPGPTPTPGGNGAPACWHSMNATEKQGSAAASLLLGRTYSLCNNLPAWDTWAAGYHAPTGVFTGIAGMGAAIVFNPVQEFVIAVDNCAQGGVVAGDYGRDYASNWVACAFERVLGRVPASLNPEWLVHFQHYGRETAAMDFVASAEFAARVQAQVAAWGG